MSTVTMLVGLPASGKSSWIESNSDSLNAFVLSSDKVREEWYGSEEEQGDPVKIFEHIYKVAKEYLDNGHDVLIDATNISQKRRIQFNKDFKKYNKRVIYFNTPYRECLYRDKTRERTVGKEVITRMYQALQIPTYAEGWNELMIIHDKSIRDKQSEFMEHYEKLLLDIPFPSHDFLFGTMNFGHFKDFRDVYELPQDNPHHTFSVSRHIYHVFKYVAQNYVACADDERDYLKMLYVSIFHDLGKYNTKSFYNHKGELRKYASFIGHENVSGQIACNILSSIGYDDEFILDVVELVQLHMKLLNASEKTESKLKSFVGEEKYNKLIFFRNADFSAK